MKTIKQIEVFRWDRARFIYNQAELNNQEPTMQVFLWLVNNCKIDEDYARIMATSPKLKC